MRIFNEQQILDEAFRAKVIKEILGTENTTRKREQLKRYEIYKDQAKKYVIEALKAEGLKPSTIETMANRAGNISILRKIINKLARTYAGGVSRETSDDLTNQQVGELSKIMGLDEKMKKADRYRELYKNMMLQVIPIFDEKDEKAEISVRTLAPWHYDVIEDANERECAKVVILSDFSDDQSALVYTAAGEEKRHSGSLRVVSSDGIDQVIADNPRDSKQFGSFIWWSDNYHFTTDEKGKLLPNQPNEGLENPIHKLPFINNAEDQDGEFWAIGGGDLVDGAVLINKQITDMNFISYHQGFGQWIFTGKNLEEKIAMGPNNAIILNYDPEVNEPKPEADVLSSNPPLESWLRIIEQYIALLLTTNNLSPSNVSMKLEGSSAASGIMLIIEQSEATDDIGDKQKAYQYIEHELWEVIKLWHNYYFSTSELKEDYMEVGLLPEDLEVYVRFNEIKPVISETEKLNAYKLRKEIGLDSQLDLIMKDNPHFTQEQAEKKLLDITAEKLASVSNMQQQGADQNAQIQENSPGSGSDSVQSDAEASAQ